MTHDKDADSALSNLRHLYSQMAGGLVKDSAQAKRIAEGILSPAIAKLEQAARRAPAAPVPQGWNLVPTELLERVLDSETVNEMADAMLTERAKGGEA